MPQVDKVTFHSQIYWSVFIFVTFYILVLEDTFLNLISMIKLRNLLLKKNQNKINFLNASKESSSNSKFTSLSSIFIYYKNQTQSLLHFYNIKLNFYLHYVYEYYLLILKQIQKYYI